MASCLWPNLTSWIRHNYSRLMSFRAIWRDTPCSSRYLFGRPWLCKVVWPWAKRSLRCSQCAHQSNWLFLKIPKQLKMNFKKNKKRVHREFTRSTNANQIIVLFALVDIVKFLNAFVQIILEFVIVFRLVLVQSQRFKLHFKFLSVLVFF